jgi:hypothetical protein
LGRAPARVDLYVAMNGNDAWTGRLSEPAADGTDGPYASLGCAREAAYRSVAEGSASGVRVSIRGGRYYLSDATVAGLRQDAREAGVAISYESFPGEEAVFSAGSDIPGWGQRQEWYLPLLLPPPASCRTRSRRRLGR